VIKLNLPMPPSINAAYANGGNKRGRHKTAAYTTWEHLAGLCVKDIHRAGYGSYSLSVALRKPDKRRRDLGNYEKCLSDFLVAHGIVKDDSFCERISLQWDAGLTADCVVIIQPFEQGLAA
jgi:crossover junction endodeoxyribonuclease RusA